MHSKRRRNVFGKAEIDGPARPSCFLIKWTNIVGPLIMPFRLAYGTLAHTLDRKS